ncbi:hypothetical protein ACOMHN_006870 [Nucella lapillus]
MLFQQDGVFIHIRESDIPEEEIQISGTVFLLQKKNGHHIEWKAEEGMKSEWTVINGVSEKEDAEAKSELTDSNTESWQKWNVSFDLRDLKSLTYRDGTDCDKACMVFILKDGTICPALYFHTGGREALMREIKKLIEIRRSPSDPELFLAQEYVADMLSKSFSELQLFSESADQFVSNFFNNPYSVTLKSMMKVTNFLWDILVSENGRSPTPGENVSERVRDVPAGDHPPSEDTGLDDSGDHPPSEDTGLDNSGDHPPSEDTGLDDSGDHPSSEDTGQDDSGDHPPSEDTGLDDSGDDTLTEEVTTSPRPHRGPLDKGQWGQLFDEDGTMAHAEKVKQIIFLGGVDPALRKEVWKFLLGFYSWESTHQERQEERRRKINEYFSIKRQWKTVTPGQLQRFSQLRERKTLIAKDVARTDRAVKFFAGEENPNVQILHDILLTYCMYHFDLGYPNVQILHDILLTYCMYHFDLGYVQGMSDLLSPLLMVMENEVDAFWCFVGLMDRMGHNFEMDQEGMKKQLLQIQILMQFYDPELFAYLESHDSGNFFFCFRWILILFKREFPYEEVPRLWEVIWTDLPCKNFHLLFALAILDTEKNTLIDNQFGFNEILKHINDAANTFSLDKMLKKAERISLELLQNDSLPAHIREILGLPPPSPPPSSLSSPSSGPSSASSASGAGSCGDETDPSSLERRRLSLLNASADLAITNFYF